MKAWNDAVFDHTGTTPLMLEDYDDYDDEDDEEPDDDDAEAHPPDSTWVSVVSRFDLFVEEYDALLAAGRAAHQRLQPTETDEDARAAIRNAGLALYAIVHEAGEPWWQLPGTVLAGGTRAYIAPAEPPAEGSDDPFAVVDDVLPPEGELLFGESWR